MNYQEIVEAFRSGKVVCWKDDNHNVIRGIHSDYVIIDRQMRKLTPLTWSDGVTLTQREDEFFVRPNPDQRLREYIMDLADDVDSTATVLTDKPKTQVDLMNVKTSLRAIAKLMRDAARRCDRL